MGNILSYLFSKPGPASIEQVVEVSEDVAQTMEDTDDLNETVAADISLIDDSKAEDLGLKKEFEVVEEARGRVSSEKTDEGVELIEKDKLNEMSSVLHEANDEVKEDLPDTNKSIPVLFKIGKSCYINEGSIEAQEATTEAFKPSEIVIENTMAKVETVGSIQESDEPSESSPPEPVKFPTPESEVEVIGTIEEIKKKNDEEDVYGGVDGLRDVLQVATPEPPKAPTLEFSPTPEPKVSTPEPVKSDTPEPPKAPTPEPTPIPELFIGTIEENKAHNDKEDMSGGVDGLRDVLQAATPEPTKSPALEPTPTPEPKFSTPGSVKTPTPETPKAATPEPTSSPESIKVSTPEPVKSPTPEPPKAPTPEPTPIPESIKVSRTESLKTPSPEPEVEVIGKIEENNPQNDEEDMSGGVEGLRDVLQTATPEPTKAPALEPTPTPEPKVSTPESVKTATPEPPKAPTPEPTPNPESIKVSTLEPVKSPNPEPPKAPTPEPTPIPESIKISTPEPLTTPTTEPEVEVIGKIEENNAQNAEEDMSGCVEGLRDVLQAATSEPPKSSTYEPTPTAEPTASTPEPIKAPNHEYESKNVPPPDSIMATTTSTIDDEEEISGGAIGLRDALQVSKDLNED